MSREKIYERLNEVFRDLFDDDELTVNDATKASDVDGWDSLRHISLLAAIEDEFDIEFSMGQTVSMKNVGEMVDYIEEELS
jgi:acyl carrier protein